MSTDSSSLLICRQAAGMSTPKVPTMILKPTFQGYVDTTEDALILFEACRQGRLPRVRRRPRAEDVARLIQSGDIFIFEETESAIKRWTDGKAWSPSRKLDDYLVYRELKEPMPPREKRTAPKKQVRRRQSSRLPYARSTAASAGSDGRHGNSPTANGISAELQQPLIAPLVDSYDVKEAGLTKKSISVTVQGEKHHLISYYQVGDVLEHRLRTPRQDQCLQDIQPREELTQQPAFRVRNELSNVQDFSTQVTSDPHPAFVTPRDSWAGIPRPNFAHCSAAVPAMSAPTSQMGVTIPAWHGQGDFQGQHYHLDAWTVQPYPGESMLRHGLQAPVPMDVQLRMQGQFGQQSPVPRDAREDAPYRRHPNDPNMPSSVCTPEAAVTPCENGLPTGHYQAMARPRYWELPGRSFRYHGQMEAMSPGSPQPRCKSLWLPAIPAGPVHARLQLEASRADDEHRSHPTFFQGRG